MTARQTVAASLATATRLLRASDSPRLDATLLLAHAVERGRAWLVAHGDDRLEPERAKRFEALVARRAAGEPVAYLLGNAWFFGREFVVTPDVLVPRPATEQLVEAVLDELRARGVGSRGSLHACDVGTGSGAIALTLAAEDARLEVVASDASAAALAVAHTNAVRLGLAGRVRFVAGDLAEPLLPMGPFDCVVANLPYVPSVDVPVAPHPVGFEPRLAVDGGEDGLSLYRRLVADLPRLLAPGASAFLEAAPGTIAPLAALVEAMLPGAHVEIGEDYSGLERWVAVAL